MKCQHCGKNEVSFVYRSNINGVTEEHCLCGECAEKLGYTQRLAARGQQMMENFFDSDPFSGFFGGSFLSPMPSLLGRMNHLLAENPFDDFFADMPALTASPVQEKSAEETAPQKSDLVTPEEQGRFAHLRQLNALRQEMKRAVRQENFERAAELRDQIRDLESQCRESQGN